jgi:hypothetical protein
MRAFGWNGTSSARAKWRSSLSACGCVLKKNLTPPTLSETRFFASYPRGRCRVTAPLTHQTRGYCRFGCRLLLDAWLARVNLEIHLVDGTYELFRHYYALPSARDRDGREVAAVRGVLASVLGMIKGGGPRTSRLQPITLSNLFATRCGLAIRLGMVSSPTCWHNSRCWKMF